jgi:hypothetical protein
VVSRGLEVEAAGTVQDRVLPLHAHAELIVRILGEAERRARRKSTRTGDGYPGEEPLALVPG